MRKRHVFITSSVLLAILIAVITWQASFDFGEYGPESALQTFVLWLASTLIFLLAVLLGFMLFRTFVNLYLDKQRDQEGSRIQTKLVLGALALSVLPVIFLVSFSYQILNRNIEKWFMVPVEGIKLELAQTNDSFQSEINGRAQALANWLATAPEIYDTATDFATLCQDNRITELRVDEASGSGTVLCKTDVGEGRVYTGRAEIPGGRQLTVRVQPTVDLAAEQNLIDNFMQRYAQVSGEKREIRTQYLLFILLIALFILFVATWIALKVSRLISSPISSLLVAAKQVREGNLSYRVHTPASDEMAALVHGFNDMTQGLEQNRRELESRRRFTEAILESIPTGVISLTSDGRIQRVNRALRGLFPHKDVDKAETLSDLLTSEHDAEIQYLMNRARRTGIASSQVEVSSEDPVKHLAVTVSALPAGEPDAPGYVVVLEDTSDLLRAQKAAAWHEVARRIAHELKNPLTPIALSAERISRQLDRRSNGDQAHLEDAERVLRQCADTITREVQSVKALADEFSQFSRFPAANLVRCNLNEVVRNGLDVFEGRLKGIELTVDLAANPPQVLADPEQMKRIVVNLVDNAAEAMQDSMIRRLLVATRLVSGDAVELVVADTGRGVSQEDKEKLFLPYFSTKGRGTGLGLAIVNHIVAEHGGRVRVEDNKPQGARFYVEIPVAASPPAEMTTAVEVEL